MEKYQVSRSLAKEWVESQQLILLLDGLDEVKLAQRDACVQALNQFIQTHGLTEIVVCCRIQDYQTLSECLTLRSAISIQSLTTEQIEQYLNRAGEALSTLQEVLQKDAELLNMATSPLILSVMSLAYQNCTVDAFPKPGNTTERYQQLFDAYIERMFQRQGTKLVYSKTQTVQWLSWLAQRMNKEDQTIFLIELMQPSWLGSKLRQTTYHLLSGLIIGILSVLLLVPTLNGLAEFFNKLLGYQPLEIDFMLGLITIMIMIGVSTSLLWGVGFAIVGERIASVSSKMILGMTEGGIICTIIGINTTFSLGNLIALLITAGLIGVSIGLWINLFFTVHIKPVENLKWSWSNAREKAIHGALGGILLGLLFGILVGLIDYARFNHAYVLFEAMGDSPGPKISSAIAWIRQFSTPVILGILNGLGFSLIFELIGGLVWGLMGGLSGTMVETRTIPNQGIWQSAKNTIILVLLGVICLVIACGLIGIPLLVGGGLGVFLGISGAGIACIQHGMLRLLLYSNRLSPWNYAHFLDHATSCILLQKVGGGYIFTHRLLLEHFASMRSI